MDTNCATKHIVGDYLLVVRNVKTTPKIKMSDVQKCNANHGNKFPEIEIIY